MQKRTLKVALLAVLSLVLVLGISAVGLAAAPWTDLPDTVTAKYGITDNQVAGISEGYPNGLWKPYQSVTRAQFTKMAVAAFNIPLKDPATASFTDVPKGSFYYPYVEGAKAAGIVNGTSATTFGLNTNITRQQAVAIVARYIADVQGFDLATMYTDDELDILLAHFGDADSIAADFKEEVAFAYDMGLTQGDAFGNFNPLANLTRIQAAAFLIRAQGLVPPNLYTPAKIELVSADKTEGLIGQTYSATFEVTDAAGHPAIGVLVDFDALTGAEFYVGQVSQEAAVTNNYGQVTVNLLSLEPGTQRVAATVQGVGTIYTTRYWLVLDEVYNTKGYTAQNNVGVEHEWCVRVVVFGPGPRSTQQGDWYNAIDASFDPTNINVDDGIDASDDWDMAYEAELAADGFTPRTLAGIDVEWAIYDVPDNPKTLLTNEAVTSVGNIVKVDGAAITPAKTAVGKTNAEGLSCITVLSEQVGKTFTEAVADYPQNPYPEQLFNHATFQDDQGHNEDWDDQPTDEALQVKTWIAHTIGGDAGPITPASQNANVGEEKTLKITLKDSFGNPVAGKYVEWTMQGVGFFNTDDAGDSYDPAVAANNVDYDVTNAAGEATLFVKSYNAGEQIIHAKVRDKGTGGSEGSFMMYTAEVQWFDADIVTFDDIKTNGAFSQYVDVNNFDPQNEAVAKNPVNTTHTFCLWVYGLKLEYAPSVDYPDGQTPIIDSDAAGASYDGIFDWRDAEYFGGVLMVPQVDQGLSLEQWLGKLIPPWGYELRYQGDYTPDASWLAGLPQDDDNDGKIDADERGSIEAKVAGRWITLSFEGAFTEYDYDQDADKEPFYGVPGIYLPLEGKSVTFSKPANIAGNVGSFTPASATTDAAGKACVDVTSQTKGLETILGTVTWKGNPHNGPELLNAYAKKTWSAGVGADTDVDVEVFIDDVLVCSTKAGAVLGQPSKAMWTLEWVEETQEWVQVLNSAHVEVHVTDAYGNDLPDYEVVYLLESIDSWLGGSQNAVNTRIPFAYLADLDGEDMFSGDATLYDTNGAAPDSDEPTPQSDPFATIVGPGNTPAFFFNQWLGSEKPTYAGNPGVRTWFMRVPGMSFDGYYSSAHDVYERLVFGGSWGAGENAFFDGLDGVADGAFIGGTVGLATDGAKAWTRDGFFIPLQGSTVVPNKLTGSHIDIQLAEAYDTYEAAHYTSILRVMVYAPANGLVQEGDFIFSCQAHQNWAAPVPATITLAPATDYAIAGLEYQTVVATVRDQFGNPVPGVEVTFASSMPEGTLTNLAHGLTAVTDENGNAAINWGPQAQGDWGVESVVAFLDANLDGVLDSGELKSNASVIQWIYMDETGVPGNLVNANNAEQKVTAWGGYQPWSGDTLRVYLNPGGNVAGSLGSAVYFVATDNDISTNLHTWISGEAFFVNAATSSNDDGAVNWVYEVTGTGTFPSDTTEP